MDNIQKSAISVNNLSNNLLTHLNWLRYACKLFCHAFEVGDLNNRQFCVDQFLFEFLILAACCVDCDTSLGNNNVNSLARSGDAQASVYNQRQSSTGQRSNDDSQFAPAAVSQWPPEPPMI